MHPRRSTHKRPSYRTPISFQNRTLNRRIHPLPHPLEKQKNVGKKRKTKILPPKSLWTAQSPENWEGTVMTQVRKNYGKAAPISHPRSQLPARNQKNFLRKALPQKFLPINNYTLNHNLCKLSLPNPLLYFHLHLRRALHKILTTIYLAPWCSRYRRRKWTRRHEFKSWTRLIAFHIALIPLGKVWIQLFSLQLWVNSRTD